MTPGVNISEKWGWYHGIAQVAKEWHMSPGEVVKRNFKEILTALAYIKDVNT